MATTTRTTSGGLEVAPYFQLSSEQAQHILSQLQSVTSRWREYANTIGINRQELQRLESALC